MEFSCRTGYFYPYPSNFRIPVSSLQLNTRYRASLVAYPRCTCECYCEQSYHAVRSDSLQSYNRIDEETDLRGFTHNTPKEFHDIFQSTKQGRRNRTTYKRWQIDELERAFLINPYPTSVFKKALAVRLGLRDSRVQVWFQNRRAKLKRDRQTTASYTTDHEHSDHESVADSISTCADEIEVLSEETEGQMYQPDSQS